MPRPELESPEIPGCFKHLLHWYADLASVRSYGMAGPMPVSYNDIMGWKALTGIIVEPHEIRLLRQIDAVFMEVVNSGG